MGGRFTLKKKRDFFLLKEVFLPIGLFLAILFFLRMGITSLNAAARKEQLASARQAVMNATVQCYALEGRYPPSVEYLRENYGLQVSEQKYIVHYNLPGSNLMPDIDVIQLSPVPEVEQ